MPLFTRENAAIVGKRGAIARWTIPPKPPIAETLPDQLKILSPLAEQMERSIELMEKERDPKNRALLARSLRDLRETWHMFTGQPLPGRMKPGKERVARVTDLAPEPVDLVQVQPQGPAPGPMTAPGAAIKPACGSDATMGSVPPLTPEPMTPQAS